MRAVGFACAALEREDDGMRNCESEGMSCWCRGGPVGTGGRPYRRCGVVDEEGEGSGPRREETLLLLVRVVVEEEDVVVVVEEEGVGRMGGE